MKRICKSEAPEPLKSYKDRYPESRWEALRNKSPVTYEAIRTQCVTDQGRLCGFCEIELPETRMGQRVEHFHPKADSAGDHNWALDWKNMLAVCIGGCDNALINHPGHYREPLPKNLSCDAHKDRLIQKGRLPKNCEGYLLNPMELVAFPPLFDLDKMTGKLIPHTENCAKMAICPNQYPDTETLIKETIAVLNLNCDRLTEQRRLVLFSIEREKKKARLENQKPGIFLPRLAARYFSRKWPSFFTTKRILLGRYAEEYLQRISFDG